MERHILLQNLPDVINILRDDPSRINTLYTRYVDPYPRDTTRKPLIGDVVVIRNAPVRHRQQEDVWDCLRPLPSALKLNRNNDYVGVLVDINQTGIILATRIPGKIRGQTWTTSELRTRAKLRDISVHGNLDVVKLDDLFNKLQAITTFRATQAAKKNLRPHQYIVRLKIAQT